MTNLGHDFWDKYFEECREKRRALCELARSLGPQQVGGLYYVGKDGERKTPSCLYFAAGYHMNKPGDSYTHIVQGLYPVYLSRNGQRLQKPEWAELCATFKNGFIKNFYVE